jgi:hypothetical protein
MVRLLRALLIFGVAIGRKEATTLPSFSLPGKKVEIYSQSVASTEGKNLGKVRIFEGEEPVDAIYAFCKKHNLPKDFRGQIASAVCKDPKVICTRQEVELYSQAVAGSEGDTLGTLRVMEGEEPADVVRRFGEKHSLDKGMQRQVLAAVCKREEVECHREVPVVFEQSIASAEGKNLGKVQILEGEEPVDAIYAFCKKHNLPKDFRGQIASAVCKDPKVICTRQEVELYSQAVAGSEGDTLGTLRVMEGEEPADVVRRFGEKHSLDKGIQRHLLSILCQREEVECHREQPVIYEQALSVDAGVDRVLQILEGEEPVDAVHHFCVNALANSALDPSGAVAYADKLRGMREAIMAHVCPLKAEEEEDPIPDADGDAGDAASAEGGEADQSSEEEDLVISSTAAPLTAPPDIDCNQVCAKPDFEAGATFACAGFKDAGKAVIVSCLTGFDIGSLVACSEACEAGVAVGSTVEYDYDVLRSEDVVMSSCSGSSSAECAVGFKAGVSAAKQWAAEQQEKKKQEKKKQEQKKEQIEEQPALDDRSRYVCTRRSPVLYRKSFNHADGSDIGTLDIVEEEEPVDSVHAFAAEHGLPGQMEAFILQHICSQTRRGVVCMHTQPPLLTHDPGLGGVFAGRLLKLYPDEAPADAVHAFMKDLQKKPAQGQGQDANSTEVIDWDTRWRLLRELCARPELQPYGRVWGLHVANRPLGSGNRTRYHLEHTSCSRADAIVARHAIRNDQSGQVSRALSPTAHCSPTHSFFARRKSGQWSCLRGRSRLMPCTGGAKKRSSAVGIRRTSGLSNDRTRLTW